jgi:hypothetical protein
MEDGQFYECEMTLRELAEVEAAFTRVLVGMHHSRPVYLPAPDEGQQREDLLASARAMRRTTGRRKKRSPGGEVDVPKETVKTTVAGLSGTQEGDVVEEEPAKPAAEGAQGELPRSPTAVVSASRRSKG